MSTRTFFLSILVVLGVLQMQPAPDADFDGNGTVDFADFIAFARAFGSTQARYDLNKNGTVDFTDFVVFAQAFGQSGGSGVASDPNLPRLRKYNVPHPVYPVDHPIWTLVRGKVQADDWVDKSNGELRSHIDEQGARRGDNALMLEVLQRLAHKYARTGEARYAYKAAVILDRYAEVIGVWPYFDQSGEKTYPHDVMLPQYGIEMPPHYGAFWSTWHPYDLQASHPLALAYDQIVNSGQMEKLAEETGQDVRLKIERDLLYANLEIADRYPLMYINTDANLLFGMLIWGQALGDPELVHRAIRFGDGLRKVSYFPSMFWHEGSPSYHMMITGRWAIYYPKGCLDSYSDPAGYRDPVDGARFDKADFLARYQPLLDGAARQMQKWVLPNGHYAAVHDTHWKDNTIERWDCYGILDEYLPSESTAVLHTWVGHATLGRGQGPNQVQAHLHFSGAMGHEHKDNLNFFLWAKNKELLSETDYYGIDNRAWAASTAGHNTVVVNEQDQFRRGNAPQRQFSDIDRVPGVEDFWFARTHLKHGTTLTDGQLRLFSADAPGIQVVEADGHRAYPSDLVKLYRRTLAMVQTGGEDIYIVDIFRVRGGGTHDWMLHGPLQDDYTVTTSLNLNPHEGTRHKWLDDLRSARTDGPWWAEFRTPTGEAVRTTVMPAAGTEVTLAQGPAMRRMGTQTFLDVRRVGSSTSVFVAVHEPHTGSPRIRSVKLVPAGRASEMAVALQVELPDRTDTILSTLDENGAIVAAEIDFQGRFGYLSVPNNRARTLYMADAGHLKTGGATLEGPAAYTGAVTQTLSTARGDALNAFVVDAPIPDSNLTGKLFLTTDGDGSTRGFLIKSVHGNRIEVDRLPGMTVQDGYVKLQYFPNWGIPGGLDFRIVNSVHTSAR